MYTLVIVFTMENTFILLFLISCMYFDLKCQTIPGQHSSLVVRTVASYFEGSCSIFKQCCAFMCFCVFILFCFVFGIVLFPLAVRGHEC